MLVAIREIFVVIHMEEKDIDHLNSTIVMACNVMDLKLSYKKERN
jgi:hypothetical protein